MSNITKNKETEDWMDTLNEEELNLKSEDIEISLEDLDINFDDLGADLNEFYGGDFNAEDIPKVNYIYMYLSINGVIEIEKLKEILEKHHEISITKEEIISLVKKIEDLEISDKYLHIKEIPKEELNTLIKMKKKTKDYKVIDDLMKVFYEQMIMEDNMLDIQDKYGLEEDVTSTFIIMMYFNLLKEEIIEIILKDQNVKLTDKKLKNLKKELKEIAYDVPLWAFNGYKQSELDSIK